MTQEQITRSVDGLKAEATARLSARQARRPARRKARRTHWVRLLLVTVASCLVLAGAGAVLLGQHMAAEYRAAVLATVPTVEPAPADVCHVAIDDTVGRVPDSLAAACDYRYNDTGARCWEDEICAVADIRDNGSFPDNVDALDLHPTA